jgi:tRNA pseudouridine38-40 synthase
VTVVKLVLAYDGTDFRGFARQPGLRTVQGVLEAALERVLGGVPKIAVAGRTDAGVHAEAQVVSFPSEADPDLIRQALNDMLGPEVAVTKAGPAPAGFDARHSATAREYRYRVRWGQVPDPFTASYEWHRPGRYRLDAMRRAAALLRGEHDFASFCRPPGEGSTVRTLQRLSVRRQGDLLEFRARADSFLHQMVRSLVGTLLAVGQGKMEAEAMPQVLSARDRSAAGPLAPPHGLTLLSVHYGSHLGSRSRSSARGER